MNRTEAVTYLSTKYARVASDTGRTATDTADGYEIPINDALRLIGTAEADLATADVTSDVSDFITALKYTALEQFWGDYAANVDIEVGEPNVNKKRSQAFKQVGEMLKEARTAAEACGVLDNGNSFVLGRLQLDFLEVSLSDR